MGSKKYIAFSQIFIMLLSIVALGYIVGSEFRIVSAVGDEFCVSTSRGDVNIEDIGQTQSEINKWCKANGGSSVCDGGSNRWQLRDIHLCDVPAKPKKPDALSLLAAGDQVKRLANAVIPKNKLTPIADSGGIGGSIPSVGVTPSTAATSSTGLKPISPDSIPQVVTPEQAAKAQAKLARLERADFLKGKWGEFGKGILKDFGTASLIYAGIRTVLSFTSLSPENQKAIANSVTAGYLVPAITNRVLGLIGKAAIGGIASFVIGALVAAIIFTLSFKNTKYKQVTFNCYPWDAPRGGTNCEKCNKGEFPCNEYQCRSLGQSCELVNQGTTEELCVWKNRGDVKAPVIQPWDKVLSLGYKYSPDNAINPPDKGVRIVPTNNASGCISPFSKITFGITLNEPAKCKIDPENKRTYDEMEFYFGESSTTKYNHTQTMTLPSPQALESENISLENNKIFALYVRCDDGQQEKGNANVENFVFKFCVDAGPDTTAPLIVTTSILNGSPIAAGQVSAPVQVYVNEPAECKWDRVDRAYADMQNQMNCANGALQMNGQGLYTCKVNLTGLVNQVNNDFYFRCKDQPFLAGTANESKRNENAKGYLFRLKGTQPLVITSVSPNSTTLKNATNVVKVKLEARTFAGYSEGKSICSFSSSGTTGTFVEFFNTNSFQHSQDLFLSPGNYNYYVQCTDLGGNTDQKQVSFTVEADTTAPTVVRAFHQASNLRIITNENASCVYSNLDCTYLFDDGIRMSTQNGKEQYVAWNPDKNFYIKCQDGFGNQPAPNQCSIVARPFQID